MSERTSIKSNKTDRPKTKVKNDPIISESTLKRKTGKTSERNKNKAAVEAEKDSIKELNSDGGKSNHNTLKATKISIPNENKKSI